MDGLLIKVKEHEPETENEPLFHGVEAKIPEYKDRARFGLKVGESLFSYRINSDPWNCGIMHIGHFWVGTAAVNADIVKALKASLKKATNIAVRNAKGMIHLSLASSYGGLDYPHYTTLKQALDECGYLTLAKFINPNSDNMIWHMAKFLPNAKVELNPKHENNYNE